MARVIPQADTAGFPAVVGVGLECTELHVCRDLARNRHDPQDDRDILEDGERRRRVL